MPPFRGSMSSTMMPDAVPVAIPMFASGLAVHQLLIWSRLVVASWTPCWVIGCLPARSQALPLGQVHLPRCAECMGSTLKSRDANLRARFAMSIGMLLYFLCSAAQGPSSSACTRCSRRFLAVATRHALPRIADEKPVLAVVVLGNFWRDFLPPVFFGGGERFVGYFLA